MRIVKCLKCGKYIHKATKCFHCGNFDGFEDIGESSIHENVIAEYNRLEILIKDKKFDEAISLSHKVIEWMPNCAGVFWIRLLARKRCISALELISKGFSCEEDSDFHNALKYSCEQEHSAYLDIQNIIFAVKKGLKQKIDSHECECKLKTDILQIKKNIQGEIDSRFQKLFAFWSELEKTERSLYELEMDCQLLVKEYQMELEGASNIASSINSEVSQLKECSEEALQKFQVKLESALKQSEQAKQDIETTAKQHIWVKTFADLVSQRDKQIRFIVSELATLKKYEDSIQYTLREINKIEERHRNAILAVNKYEFSNAEELLGVELFNQTLYKAGVGSVFSN